LVAAFPAQQVQDSIYLLQGELATIIVPNADCLYMLGEEWIIGENGEFREIIKMQSLLLVLAP
jgi:hypothetical protein